MKNALLCLPLLAVSAAAAVQPGASVQLRAMAGPDAVSGAQDWAGGASRALAVGARQYPGGYDGRDAAAALCGKLPFDSDKNACLQQVSRAHYFQAEAVGVCGALSFNSSIPDCITAMTDKAYLAAEAEVCRKESFDDDKVSCLRSSGRPAWGPRPDAGREEAAAACGHAGFESDRKECVQVVGRAYYFDRGAVGVCSRLSFSQSYPPCFRAIADKTYLPAALDICARESFDDNKVSCLQGSGQPWGGAPYPYPRWPRRPGRPWPPR